MAYKPKPFTRYRPGMVLKAADLNEAFRRLERLENISCKSPIHIAETATGRHFSLSDIIPEFEFARITAPEGLTCDINLLYTAVLIRFVHDLVSPFSGEYEAVENEISCRNLFRLQTPAPEDANFDLDVFVVRFPRTNGEWVIVQVVNDECEDETE